MSDTQQNVLCLLLACFTGEQRAASAKSELAKGIQSSGGVVLDDVVLKVDRKGKASIYDPGRTTGGTLAPALTWGLFGLIASGGSVQSLVLWAVIGALCGGLYAYFTEHLLTKDQLARIGERLGPDTSARAVWAEAPDAERLLSAAAALQPSTVSVAAIADDLSAKVFTVPASNDAGSAGAPATTDVLSMLLLRYPGQHTAKAALAAAPKSGHDAPQVELVFESRKDGKRRVDNPTTGIAAMAQMDVVSWGLFGVAWGAIVGFAGDGGILASIESGVVTGVLWAIFGLFAGILYGMWAGRAVSAGRLKAVGPLLPPDSSAILAWADGAATERTISQLSTPGATTLVLRFASVPGGAILEV